MHSEYLLINDRRNRKAVETVGERFPQLDVVSSLALIIEAVDTIDGRTLMVATKDEEVLRIFDLVCQQ
jgi:hypothetical protein